MNELSSDYKIFKESDGYYVYKIDAGGKPVERKNKEPYKSRKAALPYLRALYSAMPKSEAKASETSAPNYRHTVDGDMCEVCKNITGLECQLYKFIPQPTYTCDSFELRTGMDMKASINTVMGTVPFVADENDPQILRFKDVVLARPETNKNNDSVDLKGIQELAATIGGRPIDLDHDLKKNVGMYTGGKVGKDGELLVEGMVWLDRCAAFGVTAEDVVKRGMSIEANAETAECSVCHTIHAGTETYCEHLKHKIRYAAQRILKGLKAVGGALTPRPAGSNTGFSNASTIMFIASHEEINMDGTENNIFSALDELAERMANELEAISKRKDVSDADKKRAEKEYSGGPFADEKNKKYSLRNKEEVQAAWRYIHMPKNRKFYSADDLATMESKIKRAGKKYGIEFSDDDKNKQESNMSDEVEKDKADSPEEEKKESEAEKEAEKKKEEEMKANYAMMKKDMEKMAADLEAAQKERDEFKAKYEAEVLASKKTLLKSKLVGTVLDEDEFNKNVDMLVTLPSEAVELMMKGSKKPVSEPMRINAAETPANDAGKLF